MRYVLSLVFYVGFNSKLNNLIRTNGPNPNVLVRHIVDLLKEAELKAISLNVSLKSVVSLR